MQNWWDKYEPVAPQGGIVTKPADPARAYEVPRVQGQIQGQGLNNQGQAISNRVAAATEEAEIRKRQADTRKAELEVQRLEKMAADPSGALGVEQSRAAGFYSRAVKANERYEGLGVGADSPGTSVAKTILPEKYEGYVLPDKRLAADANIRGFIGAVLRYESGAAIPPEEFATAYKTYFPQPGEGPDVVEQKRKLRMDSIGALGMGSGPGAAQVDGGTLERGGSFTAGLTGTPDQPKSPFTSEQANAYDAFMRANPKANADQIEQFIWALTGSRPTNAAAIVEARDKGAGFAPGATAQFPKTDPEAIRLKEQMDKVSGPYGGIDLLKQGAMLGLGDEAAGAGGFINNILTAPFTDAEFDPVRAYQLNNQAEDLRLQEARERLGGTGTALEIGGGFLSGNPSGLLKAAPTLGGRIGQGIKAGAAGGGMAGFGYGEGTEGSLLSAGGGAALGAGLGAAFPIAGTVIGNRIDGLRRFVGRDPELPRRLVGEAIQADANTPRSVGHIIEQAHGRGSPMMLADTGENARALLASVGRQPGPSRTLTRRAIIDRQNAQAERISEAVVRDLGPTANIQEMGEELIARARTASRPFYQQFEAAPGASSVKLNDLITRPAFRQAMRNAVKVAQEEGADPTALGFQFDQAGDVILGRVPSWQTLDYVKRGLDDVIEQFRDPTSGKLNLNNMGHATEATRKTLIGRMDSINPAYKQARDAYAGPARMREAMEKGVRALNRSPEDIMAMMKGMGEAEQESFRLGIRKSITDLVASKRDGGDKVAFLIGTPKARAVLSRVFGGKAEFERFVQTLRDEEAMGQTYRSVAGNSMTAERAAQDAATNDTGLAESAMDAALRGGKDGMWSALVAGLQKLRDVERFGAGKAGESARESIAALLTETDPAVLRELMVAARRAAARQRVSVGNRSRRAVRVGQQGGQLVGGAIGSTTQQTVP